MSTSSSPTTSGMSATTNNTTLSIEDEMYLEPVVFTSGSGNIDLAAFFDDGDDDKLPISLGLAAELARWKAEHIAADVARVSHVDDEDNIPYMELDWPKKSNRAALMELTNETIFYGDHHEEEKDACTDLRPFTDAFGFADMTELPKTILHPVLKHSMCDAADFDNDGPARKKAKTIAPRKVTGNGKVQKKRSCGDVHGKKSKYEGMLLRVMPELEMGVEMKLDEFAFFA